MNGANTRGAVQRLLAPIVVDATWVQNQRNHANSHRL